MIAASPRPRLLQRQIRLDQHVADLLQCRRCPLMHPPPVSGGAVLSRVMLIGQAPGVREPVLGKPFAWTAGRTLFRWFEQACELTESEFRERVYMAAVCRCFPGKSKNGGGDRVPNPEEIGNCSSWLAAEFDILEPKLVLPVGKLAIRQFLEFDRLDSVIGQSFSQDFYGRRIDVIPLPHPSGASPWHRIPPGSDLLQKALSRVRAHPAFATIIESVQKRPRK